MNILNIIFLRFDEGGNTYVKALYIFCYFRNFLTEFKQNFFKLLNKNVGFGNRNARRHKYLCLIMTYTLT